MTPDLRERSERLRAYVEAAKGVAASWDACSIWPAQWVADETGKTFDWPDYGSEEEGRAFIEREGGLVVLWAHAARQIGLEEVVGECPRVGDVGIIETSKGHAGVIFAHGGVACWRAMDGVSVLSAYGRTFPVRAEGDIIHMPVVVKVWRV